MDFGKKGDAKKAMKIHHREGITLKAAWKRVKRNQKSSSTSTSNRKRASKSRTKTQDLAKKAMKLHHREGITLKAAWKKVLKFGYIPPKLVGYEFNETTGKYRKSCATGKIRNDRGRCVNGPNITLKPGYQINPKTGRQQLIYKPGYYRDPITNRWRKIAGVARDIYTGPDDVPIYMFYGNKRSRCSFGTCSACNAPPGNLRFGTCGPCAIK
tara:strand:+ start:9266 stop:9901 length:636 start_codon:yes stop_codon:yes gene_type:complete